MLESFYQISDRLSGLADESYIRVKERDDGEIIKWLRAIYDNHYYTHDRLYKKHRSLYSIYRGANVTSALATYYDIIGQDFKANKRTQSLLINYAQKIINEEVATIMRYNRDISVMPGTEEFQDRVESEVVQAVLSSLRQRQRRYQLLAQASKDARIFGCIAAYIGWNPNAGLPIKTKKEGDAYEVEFEGDKVVKLKRPLYEGEVEIKLIHPWDIGFQPNRTIQNVDWVFIRELVPVDEVIADYFGLLSKTEVEELRRMSAAGSKDAQSAGEFGEIGLKHHVTKVTFYHKKTPYVPEGAKIVFTLRPDIILQKEESEIEPNDYGTHTNGLPIEMLYDEEVQDSVYGMSRLENILSLQNELSTIYTALAKNIRIGSVPRIVAPYGSVKQSKAKADVGVMFYRGGIPPEFKTFGMVQPEVFGFKDMIKQEIKEIYRAKPAVTDLGSNIRSAGQMQIIEADQEESEAIMAEEFKRFALNIERRALDVISRHYSNSDRRFFQTMGEPGKWMTKRIKVEDLNKPWQLEVQLSDDLPRRKDRRMQTVMEMSQIWPTLFPPEAVADMFKLGASDKFLNGATVAYRMAEFENSEFRAGREMPAPADYHDHVIHWLSHDKQLQSPEVMEWPSERLERLVDHMRTTEKKIIDQALQNPVMQQAIQTQLKGFPKVFVAVPPPELLSTIQPVEAVGGPQFGELGEGSVSLEEGEMMSEPGESIVGGPGMNMPDITQGRLPDGTFGQGIKPV